MTSVSPQGESFLDYAVRMYVQVGEELYALPNRAWLRRRKAWKWRQHYALRIADEFEARAVSSVADARAAEALEARANALIEYGNSLPDGVTTEAFAEAALLRGDAMKIRAGSDTGGAA